MARDSPRYTGVGTGRRQGERCREEEARAAPESPRLTARENTDAFPLGRWGT